jgi:2-keto-4-pentenoate hydratase/2-oxohepta-3-ene-1,7-dioic acid hydratase in catechol pathway
MKLLSFIHDEAPGYGVLVDETTVSKISTGLSGQYPVLADVLSAPNFVEICATAQISAPSIPLDTVKLLAPIPKPDKIICVGLNYEEHRIETRHAPTTYPTLFSRFFESQCAHGDPLLIPNCSTEFDFEAELAVIIGQGGKHISREEALDHVAGYSCYNDGSVRDWQTHSTQFLPGKNFTSTGAFGPYLVTSDEIPDPQKLHISCRLNGEIVQDARTDQMIHSVADLIHYISRFTTLASGDVIVSGTPGGVGFARTPPLFMTAGDKVVVEVENVGTLANTIEAE